MGIPRLTQDVVPYAETAVIGKRRIDTTSLVIEKLVIDGPSLVYHVYNTILQSTVVDKSTDFLPSYVLINACFLQFLEDLVTHGAQVCSIIFDGALPLSKRQIRQGRLEKTRQNLDNYRKLFVHDRIETGPDLKIPDLATDVAESNTLRKILWNDTVLQSTRLSLLPPPPYMVPSVIESLKASQWANATHIVAGEADEFCATEAFKLGAAVVSNDSDLLLYDLGTTGVVLMLRTIQLVVSTKKDTLGTLSGQCLRPREIAKQLNVPSVLVFAFHRSQDSSSSTAMIAQRARQEVSATHEALWIGFQEEHLVPKVSPLAQRLRSRTADSSILPTDPRVSELVCSCERSEVLHMYLPVVLEDPSRDSCWSYGVTLRKLAYSMLLHSCRTRAKSTMSNQVTEYTRKGSRITGNSIQKLNESEMMEQIMLVVEMFARHAIDDPAETGSMQTSSGELESDDIYSNASGRIFLQYHLVAAETVVSQRISNSKTYQPSFFNLLSPNILKPLLTLKFTWDDTHMHATVQCTLYSIRILKQIVEFCIRNREFSHKTELKNAAQKLSTLLAGMPSIANLFLNATSLRHSLQQFPPGFVANNLNRIVQRIDPSCSGSLENDSSPQMLLDQSVRSEKIPGVVWQDVKASNKKRRNTTLSERSSSRNTKRHDSATHMERSGNTNSFTLLQEHETSSDSGG